MERGQVCRNVGGELVPFGARAYWDHSAGRDVSPEGLTLLGFASVGVRITYETDVRIHLLLRTEIGTLLIPEANVFPSDHQVINNFWFPLEEQSLNLVAEYLDIRKIRNGQSISALDFLSLVNLKNNKNLYLEYDEEVLEALQVFDAPRPLPDRLKIEPYPYQASGIRWLEEMFEQGSGALLCDEMGLGKTLQAIALVCYAVEQGFSNILIITPSSLRLNWSREFNKFTNDLNFYPYVGAERYLHPNELKQLSKVQTTYDILIRDTKLLREKEWDLIICDEAQALKNPDSKRSRAILQLKAKSKVLLTGTPVENSLKDLWTLVNIVYPGLLGDRDHFFNTVDDNPSDAHRVGKTAAPLIKRRKVADVLTDLPPIVFVDQVISGEREFASTYEELRSGRHAISQGSSELSKITLLRQYCCYPNLVVDDYPNVKDAKFQRLIEILEEIRHANEKVLIFASFTRSLDLMKRLIDESYSGVWTEILDGRTKPDDRLQIVDRFEKQPGFSVLILNPEAGGTGLNITAANHVIHFNLPWNPAKEAQATARVYRPGQTAGTVFVHRFFYAGTIEEVINDRLAWKSEISNAAMVEPEKLSETDFVKAALSISPTAIDGSILY